jgi:hypothetical protein
MPMKVRVLQTFAVDNDAEVIAPAVVAINGLKDHPILTHPPVDLTRFRRKLTNSCRRSAAGTHIFAGTSELLQGAGILHSLRSGTVWHRFESVV